MPELPEVEVVRRGLEKWVVGASFGEVEVLHPRAVRRHASGAADFAARVSGCGVTEARRRGKYLWLTLDSGEALLAHLGMSGQLLVQPRHAAAERHLRVRLPLTARQGHDPEAPQELRFVDQRTFGHLLVDRLVEPTRRAAERAGEVGLRLAIENHGDMRAHEILEVITRTRATNLGITLDNVNLIRVGDDMLEGTRLLAPHTLLVQLKDHRPTPDPAIWGGPVSVALGEGVAPLEAILDILAEAAFGGPVCVELASLGGGEVDELAMIERSVDWLRVHVPGAGSPVQPRMQEVPHG